MPVEFGISQIDSGINPVSFGTMDLESRLEEILEKDITIVAQLADNRSARSY